LDAYSPIAVLDSGLGGLTVVNALRKVLPHEDIVYFGDTAHLPYGSKSASTVTGFVRQILSFLRPQQPKHVVIACNTATALVLPHLRGEFQEMSITGVIEPGARAAVAAAGSRQVPVIGVIATEATVRSRAYERALIRRRHMAHILLRPTPLLVPMIEEGRSCDDPIVELALSQYLTAMLQKKINVLVLGCTHYPVLKPIINKLVGKDVVVIDSAEQCAQDVAKRLRTRSLLRPLTTGSLAIDLPPQGRLRTFVTDDPKRFARLATRFLGVEIAEPQWVSPDELFTAGDDAAVALRPTG
jgi:glutamate racemase